MKKLLAIILVAFWAPGAYAALVDIPVPINASIVHNGLEWAWAGPCAVNNPSCGIADLAFQGPLGWRIATLAESLLAPLATDFVFPGANVPLGGSDPNGAIFVFGSPGGDAACAAPYFSSVHFHCDWGNAPGSGGNNVVPWSFGLAGEGSFWEALLVRDIPEPGTLALLALGLLGAGFARKRLPS